MKAEYINHMGDDLTVVNAARVSFDKQSEWNENVNEKFELSKSLSERDSRLLHYLGNHNHWTPFSHPQITLRETVPIFVSRQRFKHVVGFSYNEVSRRYVDSDPEFYTPKVWRGRAENKKQGSSNEEIDPGSLYLFDSWQEELNDFYFEAKQYYNYLIDKGVAPEQARMVLLFLLLLLLVFLLF